MVGERSLLVFRSGSLSSGRNGSCNGVLGTSGRTIGVAGNGLRRSAAALPDLADGVLGWSHDLEGVRWTELKDVSIR